MDAPRIFYKKLAIQELPEHSFSLDLSLRMQRAPFLLRTFDYEGPQDAMDDTEWDAICSCYLNSRGNFGLEGSPAGVGILTSVRSNRCFFQIRNATNDGDANFVAYQPFFLEGLILVSKPQVKMWQLDAFMQAQDASPLMA